MSSETVNGVPKQSGEQETPEGTKVTSGDPKLSPEGSGTPVTEPQVKRTGLRIPNSRMSSKRNSKSN